MAQPVSPRILVVDDDEGIRQFAERALGRDGYEVVTANDGPAALRFVEAQAPVRPVYH